MLSHLVNQPQLINAFRLRATMTHGALNNCIGINPAKSRAEHMAQIVDLEIRNAGPLECSPPSLPYVSNRLAGITWTRKEKWASLPLFVFPFAKDLARLSSQRKGLCRLTRLHFAAKVNYLIFATHLTPSYCTSSSVR